MINGLLGRINESLHISKHFVLQLHLCGKVAAIHTKCLLLLFYCSSHSV